MSLFTSEGRASRREQRRLVAADKLAEFMVAKLANSIAHHGEEPHRNGMLVPHRRHMEQFVQLVDSRVQARAQTQNFGVPIVLSASESARETYRQYELDTVFDAESAPAVLVYEVNPSEVPDQTPVFTDPLRRK